MRRSSWKPAPRPVLGGDPGFLPEVLYGCWIPAWRATRLDPMVALRQE